MGEAELRTPGREEEILAVAQGASLAQGDVIVRRIIGGDIFTQAGVVVTADCHLAHRKHRGHLNFVPLLPSARYLAVTWMDDQLQERRQLAIKEFHELVRGSHSLLLGQDSTLTPEAV